MTRFVGDYETWSSKEPSKPINLEINRDKQVIRYFKKAKRTGKVTVTGLATFAKFCKHANEMGYVVYDEEFLEGNVTRAKVTRIKN